MVSQYLVCTNIDYRYWAVVDSSPSVILGLSKARAGISPDLLKNELQLDHTPQNLALSLYTTPYGKPYFDFIKKKLAGQEKSGIFILSISPESIMDIDEEKTVEEGELIYDLHVVNSPVNLEYLVRKKISLSSIARIITLFKNRHQDSTRVVYHRNGWSESTPSEGFLDNNFWRYLTYKRNKEREHYLLETVKWLKDRGTVYLVRMPLHSDLKSLEDNIYPDFNKDMEALASQENVLYLNHASAFDDSAFKDKGGSHFDSNYAQKYTRKLAKDLLNSQGR